MEFITNMTGSKQCEDVTCKETIQEKTRLLLSIKTFIAHDNTDNQYDQTT